VRFLIAVSGGWRSFSLVEDLGPEDEVEDDEGEVVLETCGLCMGRDVMDGV